MTSPASSTSGNLHAKDTSVPSGLADRNRDCDENELTDIIAEEKTQYTNYGSGSEYAWDPGPIDLVSYNFEEWMYDSDRGPFYPATFSLDELDMELEIFNAGHSA